MIVSLNMESRVFYCTTSHHDGLCVGTFEEAEGFESVQVQRFAVGCLQHPTSFQLLPNLRLVMKVNHKNASKVRDSVENKEKLLINV